MPSVEHLEAELFHSVTESGYSRPARVTCLRQDGAKVDVYLKFMGGVRNREFGLASELMCSLLARHLSLNCPTPFVVNLSPEFAAAVPEPVRDIARRSLGLNFGSESAPEGFSLVPSEPRVPLDLRPAAAQVFAFDVICQNHDRKTDNPNLLWDRRKILMIDHESAFGAVLKTTPSLGSLDLDRFYDHVFYSVLSPSDADYTSLKEALGRLSAERIESFLGEIPTQWHIKEDLAKVRDHLNWVVAHRDQVCDLIRERLS